MNVREFGHGDVLGCHMHLRPCQVVFLFGIRRGTLAYRVAASYGHGVKVHLGWAELKKTNYCATRRHRSREVKNKTKKVNGLV